jgi:hypothetical protein
MSHDLATQLCDIRAFIRLNFPSISFSFRPRDCNKAAHVLAALGASGVDCQQMWLEDVPDSVRVCVDSDITGPNR